MPVDWRLALDFSGLLTPDDVTGRLLVGVFGPAAAIVTAVLLAKVVESWLGAGGPGVRIRIGLESVTTDLSAYRTAMRTRPATVAAGAVVTALLVFVQVVWLSERRPDRARPVVSVHAPFGTGRVDLNGLTSHASWDWISTLYLLASIVALLAAYVSVFRSGQRDVIGGGTIVLSLPLMLPWGLFCLVGSLFALVMAGVRALTDDSPRLTDDGRAFIAVTLVVVFSTVAQHLALGTTRTIAGYWRPREFEEAWRAGRRDSLEPSSRPRTTQVACSRRSSAPRCPTHSRTQPQ